MYSYCKEKLLKYETEDFLMRALCKHLNSFDQRYWIVCTVQLGYCDSDVTACFLFWIMPIVQIGDVILISNIDISYNH